MGLALIIPDISFSGANLGRVTPAGDSPLTALAITGPSTVTGAEDAQQYTPAYTPSDTSQRSVTWSVTSGGTYATINASTGMLSVLPGASSSSVTIRVTSVANSSIYAEKNISVTYLNQSLPTGAIECELVYTTGYTNFINTSIVPTASMSYEVDVCWVKPYNAYSSFFGYNISSIRFAMHMSSAGKTEIGYGAAITGSWPTSGWCYMRVKHRVSVTPTGAVVESYSTDGTLLYTDNITYSATPSFTQTLGLLGRKTSANGIDNGCWRGGLGRFKLYGDASFGTLVADWIPCYYQGNFGMWDTVSQTFLTGTTPAEVFGFGSHWNTQGFTPNVRNIDASSAYPGNLIDYRGWDATRLFAIPSGCTSIRFRAASASQADDKSLMFFNSSKEYSNYYNYNQVDRVVSVPSGAAYVRISYERTDKANCYIYDVTNSQYIWNGGA